MSEPPAESWPGVTAICQSPEFAPFQGLLDACAQISKMIVRVKGKTAPVSDLVPLADVATAKIKEIDAPSLQLVIAIIEWVPCVVSSRAV